MMAVYGELYPRGETITRVEGRRKTWDRHRTAIMPCNQLAATWGKFASRDALTCAARHRREDDGPPAQVASRRHKHLLPIRPSPTSLRSGRKQYPRERRVA